MISLALGQRIWSDHSFSLSRYAFMWTLVKARFTLKNDYLFQNLKIILKNVILAKACF